MRVSIITPAYNSEKFIEQTIQSIVVQSYPCEYLVLDDGSTDHTREICEKYRKVKYFYHDNMGENRTVNRGFELAEGDLLCVLNADDVLYRTAIEDAVRNIGDYLVLYPDWDVVDEKGKFVSHLNVPDYSYRYMLKAHYCLPGLGTFMKREVYKNFKRDPSFIISDFEFWLRVGLKGDFIHLPKTLGAWRTHEGSQSVYRRKEMALDHIKVMEKLYQRDDLSESVLKIKDEVMKQAEAIADYCMKSDNFFYRKSKE